VHLDDYCCEQSIVVAAVTFFILKLAAFYLVIANRYKREKIQKIHECHHFHYVVRHLAFNLQEQILLYF
jgi:hypothetical protein